MISRSSVAGTFPTKRLGDVVEFLDSMRRPITESDRRPGPYPYYGANGQQGTIDEFIFDEPLVLLAEDGGHFEDPERGIAYGISGKTWVNNHAHVLRPHAELDLRFLCRVLENYDVTPWVTGTTRGKLTQAGAAQIVVPFPSLPEQRRIAAILDKADELRAKRRAALAKLDTLTQSIFLDMFGDPITNPKGWPTVSFGQLGENQDSLRVPVKASDRDGRQGMFAYYGASGIIDWVDDFIFEGERLLIGEDGANLVARVTPVAFMARGKYWVNNHAHVIAENDRADLRFLEHVIERTDLKPFLSGTAQPKLNRGNLDRIPVPAPPLLLQREFARRIAAIEQLKADHYRSVAGIDRLFGALQFRAFRGEL
ncbi:MAG: restriction endonuclease subunit S [Nitrospira sp.]|nr:restriction endonuclease subunit S [Nitrospira sp.]